MVKWNWGEGIERWEVGITDKGERGMEMQVGRLCMGKVAKLEMDSLVGSKLDSFCFVPACIAVFHGRHCSIK